MHLRSSASGKRICSLCFLTLSLFCIPFLCGCKETTQSVSKPPTQHTSTSRLTLTEGVLPNAAGTRVDGNDSVSIDTSNATEGYFMVQYKGTSEKARIQVSTPDGTLYSYNLCPGSYETFPFSSGNGTYQIEVYEHAYENKYAFCFSQTVSVTLQDEFGPFLYPNQYAWFTDDSKVFQYGMELSDQSSDDLDYVERVFHYVIHEITYDTALAEDLPADYIPDVDQTLETKTGICFDYAALMCALLRSQGIPTKLLVGYSGTTYHAWISVYLQESGWVDQMIEFDGKDWALMDPTLAANNESDAAKEYIGDGRNYMVKYSY